MEDQPASRMGRDGVKLLIEAVDFDQLRQELLTSVVDGPRERYHLDWPGKREALLAAFRQVS
jgi:adenine-specific DNA-methyltransferase